MLGKLLDRRYQVTQVLGAGGFGRTYLAQDTRRPGNPICVVKQLKPATSDPNFLEAARRLFNSEAETLEQLGNHSHIPRLLAYFEEDQEFYLVQEFIEGHTLSQELQPGQRWEESRVIELLQEVLSILEFVHQHGVIHRDIKPDNIIRRKSDNKLVLVDFGAVKQIRTQLASVYGQANNTIAIGTPGYMASEQALGQPRPSSDIYALGIIGIQALTGLPPISFQEDLSTGEILWQHLVQVSRGMETVLSKMVRYHFKDRYQSAAEALEALQQLNPSYPPTPYPPAPRYPSVNDVPDSGQRRPQPTYSAQPSLQNTLPVMPAPSPTPREASQPSYDPSPASSSNALPLFIGLILVVAVGAGATYAIREGSLGSLFGGDRDRDTSEEICRVVANGKLNVRSGPKGQVVDTVAQGTNLSLTGNEKNGWVEISSPKKGWVFNDKKYINCSLASQTPVETPVSQAPVETPTPKPSTPTPNPSAPTPKPVDNGSKTLAKAADQSKDGDWEKAIAIAKSIPASSPAYQEAQAKIAQWQQELSDTKAKFDKIQKALDEGRWDEVLIAATDPKFLEERYWREKLNQLIEEAKKRKAAAEAEANQQPTPPEPTPPEQSQPEPTESVQPSPEPT
ncbi:MAG TPA: protein kinase [Candidatus Sericytochromatia bacterium]|jgi:serine/threonine-protein kinase